MMRRWLVTTIGASALTAAIAVGVLAAAPDDRASADARADGLPLDPQPPEQLEAGVQVRHIRWIAPEGERVSLDGGDFETLVLAIEADLGLRLMPRTVDDTVDGFVTAAYGGRVVWVGIYESGAAPNGDRLSTLRAPSKSARDAVTDGRLATVCESIKVVKK